MIVGVIERVEEEQTLIIIAIEKVGKKGDFICPGDFHSQGTGDCNCQGNRRSGVEQETLIVRVIERVGKNRRL